LLPTLDNLILSPSRDVEERDAVPWACPLNGKSKVDHAGDIISGRKPETPDFSLDSALDIAANWRSSHGYPLHTVWTTLRTRATNLDAKALVVKRQKRMPSISSKLARIQSMQLSKMHDLGGCRAVVRNVRRVDELVKFYRENQPVSLEFVRPYDYINKPKDDGYRSVHLVYKYQGDSQRGAFKGLRIEMQIRSRLQHAWATAVESVDVFTGQGLKSSAGEEPWKRFFALIGTAMAMQEKRPLVPNTPTQRDLLISELCGLCVKLHIPDVFLGISAGISIAPRIKVKGRDAKAEAYILTLDSKKRVTEVVGFASNKEAEKRLLELEKENLEKPYIQTVMASADSVRALRTAYPNYYMDTGMFIGFVNKLIEKNAN
jgi:hypothetical protein